MIFTRTAPKRYQLNKDTSRIAATGHPWIFRSHLSTASSVFRSGQWLSLVDAQNAPVGFGIYEKEGLIGLRVLKLGKTAPDGVWIHSQVKKALAKREPLRNFTNAFRAIHGENDNLPGVVVDVYDDTAVLQTYAPSVDVLGRYVAQWVMSELKLKNLVWKSPSKRTGKTAVKPVRVLRGHLPKNIAFREGKLTLHVEAAEGQKSGAFLDLRGLRKWLAQQPLKGKRVLNLFSYTGTLGLACEAAGAREIWNVDISEGALKFAKKHHVIDAQKHRFVTADIFNWLKGLPASEKFDLIIVDPPQMVSTTDQVPLALRTYKSLHQLAMSHLNKGGVIVTCCCTARIARKRFMEEASRTFSGMKLEKSLAHEDDHPVSFDEGDYLKILVYRTR